MTVVTQQFPHSNVIIRDNCYKLYIDAVAQLMLLNIISPTALLIYVGV